MKKKTPTKAKHTLKLRIESMSFTLSFTDEHGKKTVLKPIKLSDTDMVSKS